MVKKVLSLKSRIHGFKAHQYTIVNVTPPDLWKFGKKHLQNSQILFAKQLVQIFKILKLFSRFRCFANVNFSGFSRNQILDLFHLFFGVLKMLFFQIFGMI